MSSEPLRQIVYPFPILNSLQYYSFIVTLMLADVILPAYSSFQIFFGYSSSSALEHISSLYLPIHEHGMPVHLSQSSIISFCQYFVVFSIHILNMFCLYLNISIFVTIADGIAF